MPETAVTFANEAEILTRYLIGKSCSAEIAKDFELAVSKIDVQLNDKQTRLYKLMLRSAFLLKVIDGGLVFASPLSPIRKRIFIMLALLEASKYYVNDFIPVKRNWFYFIRIGVLTVFAIFTAAIGFILIKITGVE